LRAWWRPSPPPRFYHSTGDAWCGAGIVAYLRAKRSRGDSFAGHGNRAGRAAPSTDNAPSLGVIFIRLRHLSAAVCTFQHAPAAILTATCEGRRKPANGRALWRGHGWWATTKAGRQKNAGVLGGHGEPARWGLRDGIGKTAGGNLKNFKNTRCRTSGKGRRAEEKEEEKEAKRPGMKLL